MSRAQRAERPSWQKAGVMIDKVLLGSLVVLNLAACGAGRNPDLEAESRIPENQKVGSLKAEILSGAETLQFNSGVLHGDGTVRFAAPLAKPDSANGFIFKFELAENTTVTLVTNSDRNLSSGVEVEISRLPNSSSPQVIVRASAGTGAGEEQDILDLTPFFSSVDVTQVMSLSFDIHNNHGDSAHFLAWNNSTGQQLHEDMLRGRGFGANWGLRLKGAKVTSVERSGPREVH